MWITNRRRRSTCCAWTRSGTIRTTGRMWRATWSHADASTDILMAAALGDADLVRRHLDSDPDCIRMSVSEEWFPKQDPRAGGTIYIWTLGAHRTAHSVARDFGHEEVFQLLMERTPEDLKLALACELGDEAAFHEFLSKHPDAAKTLSEADQRKLPNAAQNNNTEAVRLMLRGGLAGRYAGRDGSDGAALGWVQRQCGDGARDSAVPSGAGIEIAGV